MDVKFEIIDGSTEEALIDGAADADAILVLAEHFTKRVIEALQRCRSITRFGIGVDTIDIETATERGIWVTNVPDANYREVAVHAIALALSLSRRLPSLDRGVKESGWASSFVQGVHRPDTQVFGLLGLGRIGRRVAIMAKAIGYTVIASDPMVSADDAREVGVELVDNDELIVRSDVLSLHVPLVDSTRNIIDTAAIARMKPGSILINVSRGGLIDEVALADALERGHLFGAGIDAFANEPLEPQSRLRQLDSVILTPHAAHWSEESWSETRRKVLEEAARMLRGDQPRNPVNQPRFGVAAENVS
jgi:D-3-phosphoglycerate dehydrogenase